MACEAHETAKIFARICQNTVPWDFYLIPLMCHQTEETLSSGPPSRDVTSLPCLIRRIEEKEEREMAVSRGPEKKCLGKRRSSDCWVFFSESVTK